MKESEISRDIRLALGARPDCRLFRNNVGTFLQVQGPMSEAVRALHVAGLRSTVTKVGLCTGSSDLIGWTTVTITPEMVGSKVAIFTGIEVKTQHNKTTEEQDMFIRTVLKFGGLAGVARSVDDAKQIILP